MEISEIENCFNFVLPLVLESGKELRNVKDITTELKNGNAWDVVTIYDKKIEKLLIDQLKQQYPHHKFIGEEESADKNHISQLTNSPTWFIDPIDGTSNFVKQMPLSCISVALTFNKQRMLAVVYNPYMNELYTAMKGKGAFLNGKRITTSGLTEMKKCIFNYELSLAIRGEKERNLHISRLNEILKEICGIRSFGCAALGLCYVACGRIDAYQCDGLYPWDSAAGSLIVEEAGGYISDSSGSEFNLMEPNFLACATKKLNEAFLVIEKRADMQNEMFSL